MIDFTNISPFWKMGGYATSIWCAYGTVLLLLVFRLWISKRKLNRLQKVLAKRSKYVDPS